MNPPLGVRLSGRVVSYDDHAGIGEVVTADGVPQDDEGTGAVLSARYPFHCTQLLDGSRHAEPGQQVSFRVVPGHRGRWEAAEVG